MRRQKELTIEYSGESWQDEAMKLRGTVDQIKTGSRIVYNDGRPGHKDVFATVMAVNAKWMKVQFEDRADTSKIAFSDRGWMEFIELLD